MHANSNYDVSGSDPAHVNSDLNLSFFQYVDNDREFEPGLRRDPRIWTDSNIRASCGDLRGHHGSKDDIVFHDKINDFEDPLNFVMFTKNARLNNEDRIAEVLIELINVHWDNICFMETRTESNIL